MRKITAPVLLIGFNRPDNLQKVFDQVRLAYPSKLYIAVDGPRAERPDEIKLTKKCQDICSQVDWECELHTLFREKNAGCALGVSGAISWAFKNEDRLIILEDDCVPVQSFFTFCDEMLEKYKDDTRVWQIGGRSYHQHSRFFNDADYLFSHYCHIWGWATWKRCWDYFDIKISDCGEYLRLGGSTNVFQSQYLAKKSNKSLKKLYKNIDDVSSHTWDYQWSYIKEKNGALGIIPCSNLILNIGAVGAHTGSVIWKDNMSVSEMPEKIRHPQFIIDNAAYDLYHASNYIYKNTNIFRRIINRVFRLLKTH